MGLFEWGERRFARGIARAMIHSYKLLKINQPSLSERELVKLVLSTRPGDPAQEILKEMDGSDFWEEVANESFAELIYVLIRVEYVEHMRGSLEIESEKTNTVFREVVKEEIKVLVS